MQDRFGTATGGLAGGHSRHPGGRRRRPACPPAVHDLFGRRAPVAVMCVAVVLVVGVLVVGVAPAGAVQSEEPAAETTAAREQAVPGAAAGKAERATDTAKPEGDAKPEDTVKPEDAAKPEEDADQPSPTGKLGIRKGAGRPANAPPIFNRNAPRRVVRENAAVPAAGLMPANLADAAAQGLQQKAFQERAREKQRELRETLEQWMAGELYFVHLVCETSAEEREALIEALRDELDQAATLLALDAARREVQPNQVRVVARQGAFQAAVADDANDDSHPITTLRRALVREATERLGEPRGNRLREEMRRRIDSQRRDTVALVIGHLDRLLILEADQQRQIERLMLDHWREEWRTIPHQIPANYFPELGLPASVMEVLTPSQQAQLADSNRITIRSGNSGPAEFQQGLRFHQHWTRALSRGDGENPTEPKRTGPDARQSPPRNRGGNP